MKHGVLLINLGTPDNPGMTAVRRYLAEFLIDKRVITLPAPLRYLLVYGLILPFRKRQSAHAYQTIWTEEGSPLLVNSQNLTTKLQTRLGAHYKVVLGMRYGNPCLKSALLALEPCETITILPLYPQYSSAATGSSIEKILQLLASQNTHPSIRVIADFHSHPSYINAQAQRIEPYIANHDYLLFSYHGIPESHLLTTGCKPICMTNCPATSVVNKRCYRAQCQQTTTLIAKILNLAEHQYGTSFQSRLGRTPWIKPYTDDVLTELATQGIKRLAIVCPSFVVDCLETLEEIGIRAQQQWLDRGGESLTLIPCLNDSEPWVHALQTIINPVKND